ncbi:MAG: transcription antitermination factor NusB [Pseudomonadota bacterium]|nr:transcription antitermination factor NusB [Pseudomonadota bacterium]
MSRPARQTRSVARLAAVQALYQMEVSGIGAQAVVREFHDHRFDRDIEGDAPSGASLAGVPLAGADETFFADLVAGVVDAQGEIDKAIIRRLSSGWRLGRIDATARAILRSGTFELMRRADIPSEVVIDEYVEIAKSFFDGAEPGFVNAALDAIARDERPA